ncbi:MAG: tRNA lysidine(34) synthetase TilS [Methylophilaceae bacterium]
MANLKKPANKRDTISTYVQQFLADVFSEPKQLNAHLLIAFSGGLDSTVLMHLLSKLRSDLSFQLSAMHVHHGLSKNADEWATFCTKTCDDLNIPIKVHKVTLDKTSGLGIEAAARKARYACLSSTNADFVCLAHHQNDQAETLLLQLARGAGVKGLAGMAQQDYGRKLLRPLLNFSRLELEGYAKQYRLQWIEDESNDDTHFDRNYIRHSVLPALQLRYPAITQTLSRAAENLADASELLDDLAQLDAKTFIHDQKISLEAFKLLSVPRQSNLMRFWLAQNQIGMPSAKQLQQILQQVLYAKSDALVKIKVAESQYIRRFQSNIYLVKELAKSAPINLLWQGESEMALPDSSMLVFTKKLGEGIVLSPGVKLRIKNREGGERFRPELGRPSRTLKVVLQTSAMPPWQREKLPLVFMDETLAYIPNLGAAAELQAKAHESGYVIQWMAHAS